MTTILISILSGVLGAVIGFVLGIYKCAKFAESAAEEEKVTYIILNKYEK